MSTRSFQPGDRVIWEREGYATVVATVIRDVGAAAIRIRVGKKIYHPLRRHVRAV